MQRTHSAERSSNGAICDALSALGCVPVLVRCALPDGSGVAVVEGVSCFVAVAADGAVSADAVHAAVRRVVAFDEAGAGMQPAYALGCCEASQYGE